MIHRLADRGAADDGVSLIQDDSLSGRDCPLRLIKIHADGIVIQLGDNCVLLRLMIPDARRDAGRSVQLLIRNQIELVGNQSSGK